MHPAPEASNERQEAPVRGLVSTCIGGVSGGVCGKAMEWVISPHSCRCHSLKSDPVHLDLRIPQAKTNTSTVANLSSQKGEDGFFDDHSILE